MSFDEALAVLLSAHPRETVIVTRELVRRVDAALSLARDVLSLFRAGGGRG